MGVFCQFDAGHYYSLMWLLINDKKITARTMTERTTMEWKMMMGAATAMGTVTAVGTTMVMGTAIMDAVVMCLFVCRSRVHSIQKGRVEEIQEGESHHECYHVYCYDKKYKEGGGC